MQGESFALMYEQNRTTAELLFHHASLDLIEDYEIYSFYRRLNRSTPISGEQLYQSCEPSAFGYLQCPDGKDEEHCHELEMNECDALTEYRCLLSYNHSSCHHVSLFHCPNSSKCISRHRVQDDSLDCFTGEDEIFDGICDQLPHRFRCNIDQQCLPRRFLMDYRAQCKDGSDEAFGFRCIKPL
ncbi:unnamed protein product, partial [Rotaria sordida]